MNCAFCNDPISPTATFYRKVTGWQKQTGKTSSSQVRNIYHGSGVTACKYCIEGRKEMKGQLDIFGEEAS